jgi:hypothetical protein
MPSTTDQDSTKPRAFVANRPEFATPADSCSTTPSWSLSGKLILQAIAQVFCFQRGQPSRGVGMAPNLSPLGLASWRAVELSPISD